MSPKTCKSSKVRGETPPGAYLTRNQWAGSMQVSRPQTLRIIDYVI